MEKKKKGKKKMIRTLVRRKFQLFQAQHSPPERKLAILIPPGGDIDSADSILGKSIFQPPLS